MTSSAPAHSGKEGALAGAAGAEAVGEAAGVAEGRDVGVADGWGDGVRLGVGRSGVGTGV